MRTLKEVGFWLQRSSRETLQATMTIKSWVTMRQCYRTTQVGQESYKWLIKCAAAIRPGQKQKTHALLDPAFLMWASEDWADPDRKRATLMCLRTLWRVPGSVAGQRVAGAGALGGQAVICHWQQGETHWLTIRPLPAAAPQTGLKQVNTVKPAVTKNRRAYCLLNDLCLYIWHKQPTLINNIFQVIMPMKYRLQEVWLPFRL